MEIKIVGSITDENALEEIEDIAKIFAYEQHMKDYLEVARTSYPGKKHAVTNESNVGETLKVIRCTSSYIPVKGLC